MSDVKKVAIVTGASRGLGEGIVNGFRARGYRGVTTPRSIQPSTDLDMMTIASGIDDPKTDKRSVAAALETFGHIDTQRHSHGH